MELLAVVVILGVLAAVAMPRFSNSATWSVRGEKDAAKVAATLRLARRMAVENAAVNPTGYAVECSATSYRILNLYTGAYGPATALASGWEFDKNNYKVVFNPYGGATETNNLSDHLELHSLTEEWNVNFEPATGYVWYTGPERRK
jgi:Tfp pilus assembly protein FimT